VHFGHSKTLTALPGPGTELSALQARSQATTQPVPGQACRVHGMNLAGATAAWAARAMIGS
jgi:hypothetical protein